MRRFAERLRPFAIVIAAVASAGALAGLVIAYFAHLGPASQGVGWGMCIGGALIALVVGQSGSPSRMAVEGRWGWYGQFWGRNPALPASPLWAVGAALLVMAGGIAVIVLTY